MRLVCPEGQRWSWDYCECKSPSDLCAEEIRCQAYQEWDPKTCSCLPRVIKGVTMTAESYQKVDVSKEPCVRRAACAPNQEYDSLLCKCAELA